MSAEEYGFEVGEFTKYDHERIADVVIWPAFDHYWRGDWRAESFPGQTSRIEKIAHFDERTYQVVLSASKNIMFDTDSDRTELLSMIELEVNEFVGLGIEIDMILTESGILDDEDDEDERSRYMAKRCTVYRFDTDGDFYIFENKSIVDDIGKEVWSSADEHDLNPDGSIDLTKNELLEELQGIGTTDIDKIRLALIALEIPTAIREDLQELVASQDSY